MARIPDEEIQRLKTEVSLERLCGRYGIALTPQGKNLIGHCPWHQDDTASFVVTPATNLWHCMGACNEGGDVIALVMKAEQISFRHAVERLRDVTGARPAAPTVQTRTGTAHQILVDPDDGLTDQAVLDQVAAFYQQTFESDGKARQYLEGRCCWHPEAGERFRIGYANRTLGYRVPGSTVRGRQLKARLQQVGVIRPSGHEHLNGSVVFPIADLRGRVVQLYGRKITRNLSKATPRHLYLSGPLRGVWNLRGLRGQATWVLCEAILDALTLWCSGVPAVTCCFGKNTFTEDLWTLVREAAAADVDRL